MPDTEVSLQLKPVGHGTTGGASSQSFDSCGPWGGASMDWDCCLALVDAQTDRDCWSLEFFPARRILVCFQVDVTCQSYIVMNGKEFPSGPCDPRRRPMSVILLTDPKKTQTFEY